MSAARNAEAKRVTSIARAINWSYMWRRLMSYVWLDLLLLVIAVAILVYGYNRPRDGSPVPPSTACR